MAAESSDQPASADDTERSNKGYVIGWTVVLIAFTLLFLWYVIAK
jgi:hypothetical protein